MQLNQEKEVISSVMPLQCKTNCSSQIFYIKHSLSKLGDRTHRFSFLTVEAESLLNQLKPITLPITTGDKKSTSLLSTPTLHIIMSPLSLLFYKLNYSNCFKPFSSVLLSRSLIIPSWSPIDSFETGSHFS